MDERVTGVKVHEEISVCRKECSVASMQTVQVYWVSYEDPLQLIRLPNVGCPRKKGSAHADFAAASVRQSLCGVRDLPGHVSFASASLGNIAQIDSLASFCD